MFFVVKLIFSSILGFLHHYPLRLLADKVVELGYVEDISYETVRRTLKKNEIKP